LRFEALEARTLPTYFTVVAVPDVSALEDAQAKINYPTDTTQQPTIAITASATPAGEGHHEGFFNVGGPHILIATAPESGQNVGDPVTVDFAFQYAASLQNFLNWPPLENSEVDFAGSINAGDVSADLFSGSFSTEFTPNDNVADGGAYQIHLNVGDTIDVAVSAYGQAYSVPNHYQNWVDFSSTFSFQDDTGGRPSPGQGGPRGSTPQGLQQLTVEGALGGRERPLALPAVGPSFPVGMAAIDWGLLRVDPLAWTANATNVKMVPAPGAAIGRSVAPAHRPEPNDLGVEILDLWYTESVTSPAA
jgi:hypothetical protein